ncbi:MAG: bifunctional UDP-N-acetylglucosamine diphosphorylase/glucosamine-1-phosphate N-acetyltransferase GlmU [Chloroflexota bacterium]|jgi:bifunctional UDP-N-acetylglucosamine pyrophosphorylase/glucosamine-1-phosphate N-acetyltransferase
MEELPEQTDEEDPLVAIILAAGMGTRMRSRVHKILHRIAGDPMISHVLDSTRGANVAEIIMVVGHQSEQVRSVVGDSVRYVIQEPQLGTGHAVQQAVRAFETIPDRVLVLCGDTPLISSSSISKMAASLDDAVIALLSAHLEHPSGYGRVVRDEAGLVAAIVEEADAAKGQKSITEINSGLYCFNGPWLFANLDKLEKSPKGEYYLTDLVALAVAQGERVRAVVAPDASEVMGVNDRQQLAAADSIMRARLCREAMSKGVTVIDPSTTYLSRAVTIGADSIIHPGTHLRGNTSIGERCEIGPNSIITDSTIGDDCTVFASVVEESRVEDRVVIGPFSHLRPGSRVASDVKLGNYAEIKNSSIGEGVQMHHFSYIGDAEIGAGTNIGAGTITCNYDGKQKHKTVVGKNVFLGSDTLLRAPVEIGDGAATGAGSVVTKNVPPGKLVFGVPAREKEEQTTDKG